MIVVLWLTINVRQLLTENSSRDNYSKVKCSYTTIVRKSVVRQRQ